MMTCRSLNCLGLSFLWLCGTCCWILVGATDEIASPVKEEKEEETQFWNRFLVREEALSVPMPDRTQPRQPPPTPAPAFRIIPLPWDRNTPTIPKEETDPTSRRSTPSPIPEPTQPRNNPPPTPPAPTNVDPLPWDRPTTPETEEPVPPPTSRRSTPSPIPGPTQPRNPPPVPTSVDPLPWGRPTTPETEEPTQPWNPPPVPTSVDPLPWGRPSAPEKEETVPPPTTRQASRSPTQPQPTPLSPPTTKSIEPTPESVPVETKAPTPPPGPIRTPTRPQTPSPTLVETATPTNNTPEPTPPPTLAETALPTMVPKPVPSPTTLETASPTSGQTPEETPPSISSPVSRVSTSTPSPFMATPTTMVPVATLPPTMEETVTVVPLPTPNPTPFTETTFPALPMPLIPTTEPNPSNVFPPTSSSTTSPSNQFKQQGTFLPTETITPVPPNPTDSVCLVDVQIDCLTTQGISCNQITPPVQTSCIAGGGPMQYLTFSFSGQTCETSKNGQGEIFVCDDAAPMPAQPAQVVCRDLEGNPLVMDPSTVPLGGTFTIRAPNGNDLPPKIDCALFGDESTMLQQIIIDTSGVINLNLGDSFGAFVLESCSSGGSEYSCLETLQYQIDIINSGLVSMEITAVDIFLNGQQGSFLNQIQTNPLPAGQSTSLEPMLGVNICIAGVYATGIKVSATSSNNDLCQGKADYSFQMQQPTNNPSYSPLPTPQLATPPTKDNEPTPQTTAPPADVPTMRITLSPVTTTKLTSSPSPTPNNIIPQGSAQPTPFLSSPSPSPSPVDTPTGLGPPGEPVLPSSMPQSPPQALSPTIVTEESCVVDVTLDCVLASGLPCNETRSPPTKICSDGSSMNTVVFSYQNFNCSTQNNDQSTEASCQDMAQLQYSTPKNIKCGGSNGTMILVKPETLNPGQSFIVSTTTGVPLPDKIECRLQNPDGELVQVIRIDVSGSVSLELGDTFGALRLESCDALSCRETVTYVVDIINIGNVSTVITKVDMTLNGNTASFVDQIAINPLASRESTSLQPKVEINICDGLEYRSSVSVQSSPSAGVLCLDSADYFIQARVSPPTLVPSLVPPRSETPDLCTMSFGIDCTLGGSTALTGMSCANSPSPVQPCLDRPTSITMLFKGGDCSQSDNFQPETFSCEDVGIISDELGLQYFILVQDAYGQGTVYFSGVVAVGEAYSLENDGRSIESELLIQIYSADQSLLLQTVVFDGSCQANLDLNSHFGGSQLVEFANPKQGVVSCSQIFSFDLKISSDGGSDEAIKLTTVTANTNFAGFIDLSPQVAGMVLQPGDEIVVTLEGAIDLCRLLQYTAEFYVEGEDSSGNICLGEDSFSFVTGNSSAQSPPPQMAPSMKITSPPASISLPTVPVTRSPAIGTPITLPTLQTPSTLPPVPSKKITSPPASISLPTVVVTRSPAVGTPITLPTPQTPSTLAPQPSPSSMTAPTQPQSDTPTTPSLSIPEKPVPPPTNAPIPATPTGNPPNEAPIRAEGTPDIDVACEIEAHIACEYLICGVPGGSCDQIPSPSNVRCVNGDVPSEIILLNRGDTTSILLDDGKGSAVEVAQGATYELKEPFFGGSISFELVCGEVITIDITCVNQGFGLGDMFGQFELVGFTTASGSYNSVYEVKLSYYVSNGNVSSTELYACDVHSHFQQENGKEALPCIPPSSIRPEISPSQAFTCHTETVMIDANTKFSHDIIYNFKMKAIGVNPASEISCHSLTNYSF